MTGFSPDLRIFFRVRSEISRGLPCLNLDCKSMPTGLSEMAIAQYLPECEILKNVLLIGRGFPFLSRGSELVSGFLELYI